MANENKRPYALWRRVSTREQGDSGLGLAAQLSIALHFMGSEPQEVFTDVYTGTKLDECGGLWEAVDFCKKEGLLLVIAKTDRFRNVREALKVLEAVGEGNLYFCDIPTTDKFVLTVTFAMWERQAIMGRINTKLALEERKKQLDKNGYWISKSGNICTRFGCPPIGKDENGKDVFDMTEAIEAAAKAHIDAKMRWKETSTAYKWTMEKVASMMPRKQIIEEFNKLHALQPDVFCTREGKPLSKGVLSRWISEANPLLLARGA